MSTRRERARFRGLLMLLATVPLFVAGCNNTTRSFEPSRPADPGPPTVPPAPDVPAFPALTRAGAIYLEAADIYGFYASYHGAVASRFVLYADSTFGLQFSSHRFGFFEYGGRFARRDSLITFDWDGWSSAGKWEATATLRGDQLSVRYNFIMAMTDFLDGVYVRSLMDR